MSKLAVIKTGGKQYLVAEKDVFAVEKLDAEVGEEISFDEVLMVADEKSKEVKVGTPRVEGAVVKARVKKQGRGKKITVIKYKPKTRYRRKKGHRQLYTQIEIVAIEG